MSLCIELCRRIWYIGFCNILGYAGDYAMDYVLFQDEIGEFKDLKDPKKKEAYKALFGCTSRESGM